MFKKFYYLQIKIYFQDDIFILTQILDNGNECNKMFNVINII